ncbi:MAG: thioredoxin family protein [Burkholderiales bacterium]|nr:thioredoxin family protein [Burkholderiales bacterium]
MNSLRKLLFTLLLVLASGMAGAQGVVTRDAMTHFFDANMGDLRAELADAKAAGKKGILLMYEQEGCPACLYMKQNVLNRSDVQALYRKHFVNFTIDLFGSVPLQDFKGRDITEKAFAAEAKVRATPTFAFHDLNGTEVVRITGAVRDVAEFKLLAEFVASGAYRNRSFAEHRQLLLKKGG